MPTEGWWERFTEMWSRLSEGGPKPESDWPSIPVGAGRYTEYFDFDSTINSAVSVQFFPQNLSLKATFEMIRRLRVVRGFYCMAS